MKRSRKLIILVLALVILAAAAFILKKTVPEEGTETLDDTEYETVISVDPDCVSEVSWNINGNSYSFTKSGDGWVYDDDGSYPFDGTFMDSMLSELENVESSKIITEPDELSAYGLDDPDFTLLLDGGETLLLTTGNESSLTGEIYATTGDGSVFLIDSSILDPFSYDLLSMAKCEDVPEMADVSTVSLETSYGDIVLEYIENSGYTYSDHYTWFTDRGEGYVTLDTELCASLLSEIKNYDNSSMVTWNASEEDLVKYNLDVPDGMARIEYVSDGETGEFVLSVSEGSDGGFYARFNDSKMIYTLDSSLYDRIMNTTVIDLMPDDVIYYDEDRLQKVVITCEGETREFVRQETVSEDSEGNSLTEVTFIYNNESDTDISAALSELNGFETSGYAGDSSSGDGRQMIKMVFYWGGEGEHTVTELVINQYSQSECIVSLDGKNTVFVSRTDIDDFVKSLDF